MTILCTKIIDIGPALLQIFENISSVRFFETQYKLKLEKNTQRVQTSANLHQDAVLNFVEVIIVIIF